MTVNVKELEDVITQQYERFPFSGVIFVREQGEIVLAQGYGMANRAEQIPNTVATRLGMASGSKTFTAVAVCQLVERGLATFETRLKDYLDIPLPQFDPSVTLHHLLTHSAGIPDYFDEAVEDDYEALWLDHPMYTFRAPADFLPLFAGGAMQFKPGERWAYNNAGFILLSLVIEHLSGMPFAEYVEKHILRACGMASSGYFSVDRLPGGTALGYIPVEDGQWKTNIYAIPIVGSGDGGAYTTVRDLATFWDALMGCRLLSQATVNKMLTPHCRVNPDDEETCYGYGLWMAQEKGTPQVYYMLGEDPGVSFFSGFYPDKHIQFSLLGNTVAATDAMFECIAPILRTA
ncbi:MAG: serine hydrolase [Anaerolineae bacterium]|nr:serine hydrolase [Anaerolineae bacterium]